MLTRMNCSFAGMNFLAHAYLSFNNPEILVGNMISDFVKGSARLRFSGKIPDGIMLHRNIDEYTDNHYATRQAKEIFRPHYRLYSGAIVDVLYDHFLANDPSSFNTDSLELFTQQSYNTIELYSTQLPLRFLNMFSYMRTENWLFHYHTKNGIRNSLQGLVRRAAYLSESHTAFQLFVDHYDVLQGCFNNFFPDVKQFAKHRMEELIR